MVFVAGPLRFRFSPAQWDEHGVRTRLLSPLDDALGASIVDPEFDPPSSYAGRLLEMDTDDFALFVWSDRGSAPQGVDTDGPEDDRPAAYWLGNTETPEALWRTEKYTFSEVPYPVARWAQRELLARLEREDPWLATHEYVSWFFLPVFLSKDGRTTTRRFFAEDAAGFPDASREAGLRFYEHALETGALDDHRYPMAAKLGTSEQFNPQRMRATMAEFTVAKLLADAGLAFEPEIELTSGYALDFRVGGEHLVEVTRPRRPAERKADTPVAAVCETVQEKTTGQLHAHAGATLFVDCTSFVDDEWATVRGERPDVGYRPAVVFRARPNGHIEAYCDGDFPFDLGDAVDWVDSG